MSSITLEISKNIQEGELYPLYDEESQILEIQTKNPSKWKFGIDIDGAIIFDINQDRLLENIDVLVPKSQWQIVENIILPEHIKRGSIIISEESINIKSFHYKTIILKFDKNKKVLLIQLHKKLPQSNIDCIMVSKYCYVVVEKDILLGLYVYL